MKIGGFGEAVAVIFERIDLGVSVGSLRTYVEQVVIPLQPQMQSHGFGGWSVLSSNGDYRDGWVEGHRCLKEVNGEVTVDLEVAKELSLQPTGVFKVPTEICQGYMIEVLRRVSEIGLIYRRARISLLRANSESSWHRDALPEVYAVRLHIPIITNDKCVFKTETEQEFIPADGAGYLVRVNRLHQVVNQSDQDRYHLIMDVIDDNEVSKRHRWGET